MITIKKINLPTIIRNCNDTTIWYTRITEIAIYKFENSADVFKIKK